MKRPSVLALATAALVTVGALPTVAAADKPTGTCTASYTQTLDLDAWLALASPLTPEESTALFASIDKNGNNQVCFKNYPNSTGPHKTQYAGNAVDDTAAPH